MFVYMLCCANRLRMRSKHSIPTILGLTAHHSTAKNYWTTVRFLQYITHTLTQKRDICVILSAMFLMWPTLMTISRNESSVLTDSGLKRNSYYINKSFIFVAKLPYAVLSVILSVCLLILCSYSSIRYSVQYFPQWPHNRITHILCSSNVLKAFKTNYLIRYDFPSVIILPFPSSL